MTSSFTFTESSTFTVTHARHMAAKVATDLKRIQRLYGAPSDAQIAEYEEELTELLKGGYVDKATYGYRRSGKFIDPSVRYAARELNGMNADDHDPGQISARANIAGASFGSFLVYSAAWNALTARAREVIRARFTLQRSTGDEPGVDGYYVVDKTYSAGGRALSRSSVRSY
jgi:hypothetical protein